MKTPRVMWATAMMTDIFIFSEFMKTSLFYATAQTGSRPTGYMHYPYLGTGCPYVTPETSKHEPKKSILSDKYSLYISPQYVAKKPMSVIMYL